eukprot:TRINITY_DN20465_c0_g2_i1.p1 TRINITY_DN20465_c0_g2~~TRINITY_DN20465_c0_g2_i1.p1  ORF type:complete len:281 (-),score=54.04 TRINITY_DN20465_c0_g2_i1:114-956(-)
MADTQLSDSPVDLCCEEDLAELPSEPAPSQTQLEQETDPQRLAALLEREHLYLPDLQPDSSFLLARKELIEWLHVTCDKLDVSSESCSVAINLIDRFLGLQEVKVAALRLVAITAIFVVCKVIQSRALPRHQLQEIGGARCTPRKIIQMESQLLRVLGWSLHPVTPHAFLRCFLPRLPFSDPNLFRICQFFVDMSASESWYVEHSYSVIAAASLVCAVEVAQNRSPIEIAQTISILRLWTAESALEACRTQMMLLYHDMQRFQMSSPVSVVNSHIHFFLP